ncbi:non-ribosomal peptide synthetase [Chitinophaga sp. LS1]|uniref:non-ribosomal peptide synthetase n=1 Tax=Chitinophaga sp. LS1 TaxID=3051176 RepID=UPI002AAB7714|nr:non-ribosomal peptide synthetase [Chitinophaga sp. LS1]WPV65667.1 amino acid adenylation domain-containing protein [Chitinophaga sp. LS1]
MNVKDLLDSLREKDVSLAINEKGNLDIKFPKGVVTGDILTLIKSSKQEIVDYLLDAKAGNENIPPVPVADSYPLSSGQLRLWLLEEINNGFTAYNIPKVIEINTDFDLDFAERAFLYLIGRHEILRTVFKTEPTRGVRQYVLATEDVDFRIVYHDLSDSHHAVTAAHQIIAADKALPIALDKGPLFRVAVFKLGEKRYLLYCNMHHIISDGWSVNIFSGEFNAIYAALAAGKEIAMPPLDIQYKDFAVWQQQQLLSGSLDRHRTYWLSHFSGELPLFELPVAGKRPAVFTHRGEVLQSFIGSREVSAFKQLCYQQQATLFMGLLGVLHVLLYRYTGQGDLIIGTPVAGRDHANLQEQIGLYVNTLGLRIKIDGVDNFGSILQQIRQVTLNSYEHQLYPFDQLLDDLHIQRDLSRSPLFDIMFVLHNERDNNYVTPSTIANAICYGGDCAVKFDLNFDFTEVGNALFMRLAYNSDIYSRSSMETLVQHFMGLFCLVIENIHQPVRSLSFLTNAEIDFLHRVNKNTVAYPVDKTLVMLFREQVKQSPSFPALFYDEHYLTYQELDAGSERIAAHLLKEGVTPQQLIPVVMDRCPEMLIAILGILKAGGVYVPMDPANGVGRISFVLEETNAAIVLTSGKDMLPLQPGRKIFDVTQLLTEPIDLLFETPPANDQHLTCVIYTSGSTGNPKGVLLKETSILNRLYWMWNTYPYREGERSAWKTSGSFADHICEVFGPLLKGIPSVLFRKEEVIDISFVEKLSAKQITRIVLVPSLLRLLLETIKDRKEQTPLPDYWVSSGEPLPLELVTSFKTLLPGSTLLNIYGSTEVTADVTFFDTREDIAQFGRSVPIGKPLYNFQVYILDAALQPVPPGYPGEICVSGIGLAAGYFAHEQLTKEKFIPHPFIPGQLLFRTGDQGRLLPDGNFICTGRMDDQLKIRGIRIEPGEIEQALRRIPGIMDAVVIANKEQGTELILIAYIKTISHLDINAIRKQLSGSLADYMIPSYFVQLEVFPLTVTGKINKKALPLPVAAENIGDEEIVFPVTLLEKEMAAIWQEVLKKKVSIGIHHDFFSLGGHSLNLMQISNAYSRKLGVTLSMQDLFRFTTIADQAALITGMPASPWSRIMPVATAAHYPVSDGQRRMWVMDKMGDLKGAYNLGSYFVLDESIQPAMLEEAINSVIARHEILRTIFRETDEDQLSQVVLPASAVKFILDINDIPDAEAAASHLRNVTLLPFDTSTWPLLRGGLVRSGNAVTAWFCMHHIISDGWSVEILKKEIMHYYSLLVRGERREELPLAIQYKDYTYWLQERLNSEAAKSTRQFWLDQFREEIPVLTLPFSHQRPVVKTFNGKGLAIQVPADACALLSERCQAAGVTIFVGLISVFRVLLYRYSGQAEIVIGTPVAGRDHAELEDQVGFYVNTLALQLPFKGGDSFHELLAHAKTYISQAFSHQWYPFDRLVDEIKIPRDVSRSPLFDVLFVLHNEQENINGITKSDLGQMPVKFDLQLDAFQAADGSLSLKLGYNTDLFDERRMTGLLQHFSQLLRVLSATPGTPVDKVDYLLPGERTNILSGFNQSAVLYPEGRTLVSLFYEQAARRGDEIALYFKDRAFTWKELEEWSSRLANFLLEEYDIKKGALIPVNLHRSEWLVISILAVIKTGCAYVPVGADYPPERITWIKEDCGAEVIVNSALIDTFRKQANNWQPTLDDFQVAAHDLAYVIYTSGSTGMPKGCMLEHGSVVNRIEWMYRHYGFNSKDRILQKTTFTFDVSVWEIFLPLCWGTGMVLCEEEDVYAPGRIVDLISRHQITCLHFVPGMLQAFMTTLFDEADNLDILSRLRMVVTSGEALSPSTVDTWYKRLQVPIANLYGPTEAAVDVTYYDTRPGDAIIPIGRPVANTSIYILDDHLQPVPVGVHGEIFIGGVQVARGYLNREELTARSFLPGIFEHRLYRTGDIGRWQDDGNIIYAGRRDNQVKIRGYRIEVGEVEYALHQQQEISAAVVLAGEDNTGGKCLKAYYSGDITPAIIRERLVQRLPDFMVPQYFIHVAVFPMTGSGKIDRRALAALTENNHEVIAAHRLPVSDKEAMLVELYEQLFGKKGIGTNENFFLAGGNSLKAIWLVNQLKKKGYQLAVTDVLKYPVIHSLAPRLGIVETAETILPVVSDAVQFPLSYNQQIYWNGKEFVHAVGTFYIQQPFTDEQTIIHIYRQLLSDNSMLRMKFDCINGQVYQFLLPLPAAPAITFIRQDEIDLDDPAVSTVRDNMINVPFALEKGEVIRCAVLYDRQDAIIFMAIHHIVTDHFSNKLLKSAFLGNVTPSTATYLEFISLQQTYLASAVAKEKKLAWERQMAFLMPKIALAAPPATAGRLHYQYRIDTLSAYNREHGYFMSSLLLAACFINDWLGHPASVYRLAKVTIGGITTPVPGFDASRVAGVYVNSVAVVGECREEHTIAGVIEQVQHNYLEGRVFEQVPMEYLREASDPDDYYFASFSHLEMDGACPETKDSMPGLSLGQFKYSYYLRCMEYQDGIILEWKIARIEDVAYCDRMKAVLSAIIESPQMKLNELSKILSV